MPTPPALSEAWDKLGRAIFHYETLEPQVEAFEGRDSHRFSCSLDAAAGHYAFFVHDLETPPSNWGLIIGDCLHNARTALDYLAVRLVAKRAEIDPADVEGVAFPIFGEKTKAAAKEQRLAPFGSYGERIDECQLWPLDVEKPTWGLNSMGLPIVPALPVMLWLLSTFDNRDKHRNVQAAWVSNRLHGHRFPGVPVDFRMRAGSTAYGPFEEGSLVGELWFETPLPSRWDPTPAQMAEHFTFEASLVEPLPPRGVLEFLWRFIWAAGMVLEIFAPIFAADADPLPVTHSLTDEDRFPRGYRGPSLT